MSDFMSVLSKKASDVTKPPARPVGSYLAVLQGAPKEITRIVQGEEKPILSFKVKLVSGQQVDDQEALAAQGDIANWAPLNHDIWLGTPEGEWQLRSFLTDVLEIDPGTEEDSKSLGEMVAEANGRQLLATITHRPGMSRDGKPEIYTQIGSVAKI